MSTQSVEAIKPTSTPSGCAWGNIKRPSTCSLFDVIHEEQQLKLSNVITHQDFDAELALAMKLSLEEMDTKEKEKIESDIIENVDIENFENTETPDSDLALAMQLQELENDEFQKWKFENRAEKYSKVTVVPRYQPMEFNEDEFVGISSSSSESNDETEEPTNQPASTRKGRRFDVIKNELNQIITKHDPIIDGRANAREMSEYEGVGDLVEEDIILPNKVFNILKSSLKKKETIKGVSVTGRAEKTTKATENGVLDPITRHILFKMINNGIVDRIDGVVKTGKEAHVFHTMKLSKSNEEVSIALKIFKTTLNEFSNREDYIEGDFRYKYVKLNSKRKIFKIWAIKEYRNLIRANRIGINCPQPIYQKQHLILMSFIGKDGWPAPQLKEVSLSPSRWKKCYFEILKTMRDLYQKAKLVHGDLSEYNILFFDKKCFFIDFGQAVEVTHPNTMEFLTRDVEIINKFFLSRNIDILATIEIINFITEKDLPEDNFISQSISNFIFDENDEV